MENLTYSRLTGTLQDYAGLQLPEGFDQIPLSGLAKTYEGWSDDELAKTHQITYGNATCPGGDGSFQIGAALAHASLGQEIRRRAQMNSEIPIFTPESLQDAVVPGVEFPPGMNLLWMHTLRPDFSRLDDSDLIRSYQITWENATCPGAGFRADEFRANAGARHAFIGAELRRRGVDLPVIDTSRWQNYAS